MRASVSSLLLVMWAITAPGSGHAHGGKLQLARAQAGPYAVSAWTHPDPPRVGRLDVSVAVLRPDTGQPVENVDARVTARHLHSFESVSTAVVPDTGALSLFSSALRHGTVELRLQGGWRVNISVAGPQGKGDVEFDLEAEPPWGIPAAGYWVGVAIIAAFLGWTYRHSVRSPRAASVRAQQARPESQEDHH